MNEITLGFELAAILLTAGYLARLIALAVSDRETDMATTHFLRFEKRSLLNQRIYEREILGGC